MMHSRNHLPAVLLFACFFVAGSLVFADKEKPGKKPDSGATKTKSKKVVKSEEEWKKQLTPEQFLITRKGHTERAFGKAYHDFKKQGEGTYFCVCCGSELFSSNEKFSSGCGWPSFYDPSKSHNVAEKKDVALGMVRTEVVCAVCDAHLGHVFAGEGFDTPTDKRYCINMAALRFAEPGKAGKEKEKEKSGKEKEGGKEKEKREKPSEKDD